MQTALLVGLVYAALTVVALLVVRREWPGLERQLTADGRATPERAWRRCASRSDCWPGRAWRRTRSSGGLTREELS